MQMEITKRDKKLLAFLAVFVIVVGIGYWGIYPQIKAMRETAEQKTEAEELKAENERKIMELDLLKVGNEKLQESIKEAKEPYYSEMSSAEIDRYFTDMALSYDLLSYDLAITMPEEDDDSDTEEKSVLEPYQYADSQSANETAEEETTTARNSGEQAQEAAGDLETTADSEEELVVPSGIHVATVTQHLVGSQENFNRLLNDLAKIENRLLVQSYSYTNERTLEGSSEETYSVQSQRVLNLTMQIYMCPEDEEEDAVWK